MRKNAPRKWIHAILDLLPLLVIPIFAIYTRNESNTFENNITLEVEQNKVVDFNQLVEETSYTQADGTLVIKREENNHYYSIIGTPSIQGGKTLFSKVIPQGHKVYLQFNNYYYNTNNREMTCYLDTNYVQYVTFNNVNPSRIWEVGERNLNMIVAFSPTSSYDIAFTLNIYDLTVMFGVGNEPTMAQFNQWYPNVYYPYTISETQLLKNYSVETLNNTDIGSQFLYSVYKPVNDYFNFNNLFNMQGIYDWLQLNLFGGNAPLPVLIVWNIIVYEFFIDLIFLLYSVFMFIIDWSTSMLDRFLYKSRS